MLTIILPAASTLVTQPAPRPDYAALYEEGSTYERFVAGQWYKPAGPRSPNS